MKTHLIALSLLCMWSMGCGDPKKATAAPICDNMTQSSVKLPDGTLGAVVCCQHKADCYKLGTLACGTYKITQANNAPASDFVTGETVSEYVIVCKQGDAK